MDYYEQSDVEDEEQNWEEEEEDEEEEEEEEEEEGDDDEEEEEEEEEEEDEAKEEEEEEEEEEDDAKEEEEEEEENDTKEEVEDLVATKKDKVPVEINDMDDFVAAMNHYETEKAGLPPMPIKMEAGVELLSIIRQSNASMELYFKIVKWTEQYLINSQKVPKPHPQENVTKYLASCYKLDCMEPCQSVCRLPSTNLFFNMVRHSFFGHLFSLLTDESLMKPEIYFSKLIPIFQQVLIMATQVSTENFTVVMHSRNT